MKAANFTPPFSFLEVQLIFSSYMLHTLTKETHWDPPRTPLSSVFVGSVRTLYLS